MIDSVFKNEIYILDWPNFINKTNYISINLIEEKKFINLLINLLNSLNEKIFDSSLYILSIFINEKSLKLNHLILESNLYLNLNNIFLKINSINSKISFLHLIIGFNNFFNDLILNYFDFISNCLISDSKELIIETLISILEIIKLNPNSLISLKLFSKMILNINDFETSNIILQSLIYICEFINDFNFNLLFNFFNTILEKKVLIIFFKMTKISFNICELILNNINILLNSLNNKNSLLITDIIINISLFNKNFALNLISIIPILFEIHNNSNINLKIYLISTIIQIYINSYNNINLIYLYKFIEVFEYGDLNLIKMNIHLLIINKIKDQRCLNYILDFLNSNDKDLQEISEIYYQLLK